MEMTDAFVKRVKASSDFDGVVLDIALAAVQEWQMKYFWNMSKEKEPEDPWRPDSLEEIVVETSKAADELGIPLTTVRRWSIYSEHPLLYDIIDNVKDYKSTALNLRRKLTIKSNKDFKERMKYLS